MNPLPGTLLNLASNIYATAEQADIMKDGELTQWLLERSMEMAEKAIAQASSKASTAEIS